MATIVDLKRIAEVEFFDIVKESFMITCKLRIILIDNSFIDVNLSIFLKLYVIFFYNYIHLSIDRNLNSL